MKKRGRTGFAVAPLRIAHVNYSDHSRESFIVCLSHHSTLRFGAPGSAQTGSAQTVQYQGAGVMTGFGLRLWQTAQR